MVDERAKMTEQLRRYRALLGASADPAVRAALQAMIGRIEARLTEEGGEPSGPPPLGKHPNR